MEEQTPGLRFDIYERIHVKQELSGLQDLENMELIPKIDVLSEGEQALLRGYLRLNGHFANRETREESNLLHEIPVEITLPMSRIHHLADIGVEIEDFDVEFVHPHSLSVTGVLLLRGVEIVSQDNESSWQDEEEEVFVHAPSERMVENVEARVEVATVSAETIQNSENAVQNSEDAILKSAVASEESAAVIKDSTESIEQSTESIKESVEIAQTDGSIEAGDLSLNVKPVAPKIAFTGKKDEDHITLHHLGEADPSTHQSQAEVLQAGGREPEMDDTPPDNDELHGAEEPARDGLGWKHLFLDRDNDASGFSKMRMCIVQKEDSIETIAERYSMNPRELQLCNRMSDNQSVFEGQVIYIPK